MPLFQGSPNKMKRTIWEWQNISDPHQGTACPCGTVLPHRSLNICHAGNPALYHSSKLHTLHQWRCWIFDETRRKRQGNLTDQIGPNFPQIVEAHLHGFLPCTTCQALWTQYILQKKQFSVDSRFDLNTCWRDCCIWPLKHDICRGQVTNQDFIGLLYTFVFLQSNSEWNVFRFSSGTLLLEKEKWCHREWMGQPNLSKRALVKLQQNSSRWRGDCQNDTHCPVRTEHKQLRKKKTSIMAHPLNKPSPQKCGWCVCVWNSNSMQRLWVMPFSQNNWSLMLARKMLSSRNSRSGWHTDSLQNK